MAAFADGPAPDESAHVAELLKRLTERKIYRTSVGRILGFELSDGDLLLEVNGRSIATPDAAMAAFAPLRTASHRKSRLAGDCARGPAGPDRLRRPLTMLPTGIARGPHSWRKSVSLKRRNYL